jgi:hypothetical protein
LIKAPANVVLPEPVPPPIAMFQRRRVASRKTSAWAVVTILSRT